jgi:hypothetical protein
LKEIAKIISDDFFKFDKITLICTDDWSIIMKFKSWFCSDSKLIYVKNIIEKMNMLISTSDYIILWLIFLMYWSFLEVLIPSETYYVENIKSTNFILGTNTKATNLRIHKLVIFNQTTKTDTHEEKYFHSTHMCI